MLNKKQFEDYISSFNSEKILFIETNKDKQYIHINKIWNNIGNEKIINEFLYLIIQNSIISYQLSGTGEQRREEFSNEIDKYFKLNESNIERRINFLGICKKNCRLQNIKINRLIKIDNERQILGNLCLYGNNQTLLAEKLGKILSQKMTDKTIVFAIKMYIYAYRIIFKKNIKYDKNIGIPLDSRLTKIYENIFGKTNSKKEILDYFLYISNKNNISQLELDSILWIDYRNKYYKKNQ